MTIDRLMAVVPPPKAPCGTFNGRWEPLEAALGVALPQDYKDFVRLYGAGYFLEFLGVYVPASPNPNLRLEARVPQVCHGLSSVFSPDELAYPFWPAPGGLVPFGGTDNGDDLFWLTRGKPAEWKVVVLDRGLGRCETLDCDLTDFLAGLAAGEISPQEFPEDLLPCDRPFIPDLSLLRGAARHSVSWRADWRRW